MCVAAARLEHTDQRIECTDVFTTGPFIRPFTKLPDPHIQISNRAEDLTQPSEIRPEPARPDRERRFEDPQDGAEPPRRHPHPVELLRILPQSRTRLVREHLDEEFPKHRERQVPCRAVQVERRAPEVSCERALESASEEPGLELRMSSELEPALLPKTLDERGDLGFRCIRDLNLHPSQPCRFEPWTDADHGPIKHYLARTQRTVLQREDLASRADLEEFGELTTPDEGPNPPTDLAVGPERDHVRNG